MALHDSRNPRIKKYNTAVETWEAISTSGGYKDFDNEIMTGTFTAATRTSPMPLPLSTVDSKIADNGATGDDEPIKQYTDVAIYKTKVSFDLSNACDYNGGCKLGNAGFLLTVNSQTAQPFGSIPTITAKETSATDQDRCADGGNFWDSSRRICYEYSVVTKLCAKVRMSSPNPQQWSLDSSYGGYGCGDNDDWTVGSYKALGIYTQSDFPGVVTVDVEVRATKDPKVQFYEIVGGGAKDFGYSQAFLLTAAFVLFGFGGLCSAGVIFFCLCVKKAVGGQNNTGAPATTTTTTYQKFENPPAAVPQQYPPQQYAQPPQQYPPQQYAQPTQQQYPPQQGGYPAPGGAYPPPS